MMYILNANNEPVKIEDPLMWGQWMATANRVISQVTITRSSNSNDLAVVSSVELPDETTDSVCVSTVFLGLDHNFSGNGPPLLFETLIFGGPLNHEMHRYSTFDEAARGHQAVLDEVMTELHLLEWQTTLLVEKVKS